MNTKYRNIRVTDPNTGAVFDSKREYNRWCELRLLERCGAIKGLTRQVKFELLPKGKYRAVTYVADFVYMDSGKQVVEDAKGVKTKEYIIKKKMLYHKYGIDIKET
ncbi:MAG: DUF1064 domain-containing protein [Clostridiales bacterium]|jgi:hypothetical protein|nr:DUF1064 domain-containing protein [Clostridiales bacterium]